MSTAEAKPATEITARQITDFCNTLREPRIIMLEKALILISRLSGSPDGSDHMERGAEILAEDWNRRTAAIMAVVP